MVKVPATVTAGEDGLYVGNLPLIVRKDSASNTAHLTLTRGDYAEAICGTTGAMEALAYIGERTVTICAKCRKLWNR